ncbi:hypothetical protein Gogos_005385 [Gossypium gossypioides]|uniref:Uncharacterized protein n=1 Tax=Gossypium gossypioides TaxID=34282 RepID=A0A7J9D057_GOSGO|nr:hypothetical protein [Gossypium gossypioides]
MEEKWMAILQNLLEEDISGEPLGCFRMRSCIDVVISIGFLCLEVGELLDMDDGYRKKIQEISSA